MTLQTENLSVSIGGKIICRDLDFTVSRGECWGILGQNGSGKTTLLRTLAGLHLPDAGTVNLNEQPLSTYARRGLARQVGVLPQNESGEFWGSVQEYVLLGRFPYRTSLFGYAADDEAIVLQSLTLMELNTLALRPLNTLSGGERQRAAIAQLLAQKTAYCLLDEPLQHLDIRHQLEVMRLLDHLKEQGFAILVVLHDVLWAQRFCDHVLLMHPDGRVQSGKTDALLTRENLETLYQCPLLDLAAGKERYLIPGV